MPELRGAISNPGDYCVTPLGTFNFERNVINSSAFFGMRCILLRIDASEMPLRPSLRRSFAISLAAFRSLCSLSRNSQNLAQSFPSSSRVIDRGRPPLRRSWKPSTWATAKHRDSLCQQLWSSLPMPKCSRRSGSFWSYSHCHSGTEFVSARALDRAPRTLP
jgi:hypothetical protein